VHGHDSRRTLGLWVVGFPVTVTASGGMKQDAAGSVRDESHSSASLRPACCGDPTSGCFADPPAAPEVQPLEIVVGNPDPKYGPCLLNVDEVGAGTHDVTPGFFGGKGNGTLAGKATVRILDPSGAAIFERTIEEHRLSEEEGGGIVIPPEDTGFVRLGEGNHSR
jgi:hypothetical protein